MLPRGGSRRGLKKNSYTSALLRSLEAPRSKMDGLKRCYFSLLIRGQAATSDEMHDDTFFFLNQFGILGLLESLAMPDKVNGARNIFVDYRT